jgi:hypothetical protein
MVMETGKTAKPGWIYPPAPSAPFAPCPPLRALTILAVAMALALLGFLLTSIGVKAWEGFSEAQVRLTIPLDIPLTSPPASSATATPGQAQADPFALLKADGRQRFGNGRAAVDHCKPSSAAPLRSILPRRNHGQAISPP